MQHLRSRPIAHPIIAHRALAIAVAAVLPSIVTPTLYATRAPGIDVSDNQGTINWATTAGTGVQFAFIRTTRGGPGGSGSTYYTDTKYSTYFSGAAANGILAGPYHRAFPFTTTSATAEADFFYSVAKNYMKPGYIRPVLDLEAGGDSSASGKAALTQWVIDFCTEVQNLCGNAPIIYTNTNYAQSYLNSGVTAYDLWVANWTLDPTSNPGTGVWGTAGKSMSFFQYSDLGTGSTYGASSSTIDLDVANGDINFVKTFFDKAAWTLNGDGNWNTTSNWNTLTTLPASTDDVVITRTTLTYTITHSSGTHTINSLVCNEKLSLTGGSLTVSGAAQLNNTTTLSGATFTTNSLFTLPSGVSFTTSSGSFNANAGLTNNGTYSQSAGNLSVTGALSNASSFTASGGTVSISGALTNSSNFTASGAIVSAASLTTSGNLSITGGSLTTSGAAQFNHATTLSSATLTTNGLATIAAGVVFTNTGTFTANAGLTNSGTYLQSAGSLSITGTLTNSSTFTATGGSFSGNTVTNTGSVALNLTQNWTPSSTFNNNSSATANFGTDAGSSTNFPLTINANSASGVTFNSSQHLASLSIGSSGKATLSSNGSRILYTKNLSITSGGTLDLNNNDAIVDYTSSSPLSTTILPALFSARNGGAWTGTGITSTSAKSANDPQLRTAIGYAESSQLFNISNSQTASFDGQTVDATSIVLKYTWYGDANLDGLVTADDYTLIDRGMAQHLTGWLNGDFNYDNVVNSADYLLIDRVFTQQTGVLSPDLLADRQAQFGDAYVQELLTSIPEPSSLFLLTTGCCLLAARLPRRPSASPPSPTSIANPPDPTDT